MASRPVLKRSLAVLTTLAGLLVLAPPLTAKKIVVVPSGITGQVHDASASTATRLGHMVSSGLALELLPSSAALAQMKRLFAAPPQHERTRRLEEITRDIQRGDELLYTDPEAAIPVLDAARLELQQLMESQVPGDDVQKKLFEAQMLLARSHLDNGDKGAAGEVMEQIIHRFGERDDINTDNYHPAMVDLYQKTVRRLARKRTGQLRVTTGADEGLEILLNRVLAPTRRGKKVLTPTTIERLLPGEYRVQVRRPGGDVSLVHLVTVAPRGVTELSIDLAFDLALQIGEREFSLGFADRQAFDERAVAHASRLARTVGADEALVVGFVGTGSQPRLVARRLDAAAGRVAAAVEMEVSPAGPSDAQLFQATQVLCGFAVAAPTPSPGPETLVAPEPAPLRRDEAPAAWYTDWLGWTLVGVGLTSVGVAGYFTADSLDKEDCATNPYCGSYAYRKDQAQSALDGRAIYGALYGVGGAAILSGVLVFALRDRGGAATASSGGWQPLIAPLTAPEGTGLSFQGRF